MGYLNYKLSWRSPTDDFIDSLRDSRMHVLTPGMFICIITILKMLACSVGKLIHYKKRRDLSQRNTTVMSTTTHGRSPSMKSVVFSYNLKWRLEKSILVRECHVSHDTTTKVRVVYDGSAMSNKSDLSLKECLFRGPVLLPYICGILLRFRINEIILQADIEKAFLQISVEQEDRDVLRFFWYKDPKLPFDSSNVRTLRFARVPFGLISSPFLLAATIEHHLRSLGTHTAQLVLKNIYVDNVILGCNTATEALQMYSESKNMFASANMNLREWASNCEEVTNAIPEQRKDPGGVYKMLGLNWHLQEDTLSIAPVKMSESPATKRLVLCITASVFDPMGFFSPATLQSKLLLQRLWEMKVSWDDLLTTEVQQEWNQISQSLQKISEQSLPRLVGVGPGATNQLMVFTDASAKAYAAIVYLRSMTTDGNVTCNLVFCKNSTGTDQKSVRPQIHNVSLPRMELLGVLIGVRALVFVRTQLDIKIDQSILWTDSACILQWLHTSKPLPRFVSNRITEINSVQGVSFRHVSTTSNPADIPSRGCQSQDLIGNTFLVEWSPMAITGPHNVAHVDHPNNHRGRN